MMGLAQAWQREMYNYELSRARALEHFRFLVLFKMDPAHVSNKGGYRSRVSNCTSREKTRDASCKLRHASTRT